MNDVSEKNNVLNLIKNYKLKTSFVELELKFILFIYTLKSFRLDSLLRPFPKKFLTETNEKNFDKIKQVVKEIPNLKSINDNSNLSEDCWSLLYWIFKFNLISLDLLNREDTKNLLLKFNIKKENFFPQYIFKVKYPSARARFEDFFKKYSSFQAFHGTKVENVYSIIHNGLINNLNKRDAFGPGTYFSKKIDVAILFSPFSFLKNNSCNIYDLSCIFLCDIIDHPSVSMKESYYIVQNDDLINITHLLVYCKNRKEPVPNESRHVASKIYSLISVLIICLISYVIYVHKKYY